MGKTWTGASCRPRDTTGKGVHAGYRGAKSRTAALEAHRHVNGKGQDQGVERLGARLRRPLRHTESRVGVEEKGSRPIPATGLPPGPVTPRQTSGSTLNPRRYVQWVGGSGVRKK